MAFGEGTNSSDELKYGVALNHQNGSMISVTISAGYDQSGNPSESVGDVTAQDLVDYLAAWPKLGGQILASKVTGTHYSITPTEQS